MVIEVADVETGFEQLEAATKGLTLGNRVVMTFLGDPWDGDEMVWEAGLRRDMLPLALTKRKLCLAKELGLSVGAAYGRPGELVERLGPPTGVRVVFG